MKGSKTKSQNTEASLDFLDKKPISELLTLPTKTLFDLQTKAGIEFEKSSYRRRWIEGIIELKYKSTLTDFYRKAHSYLESEPIEEMDRYNRDSLVHYIEEEEGTIEVRFYRGYSETFNKPNIQKRFRLLEKMNVDNDREEQS